MTPSEEINRPWLGNPNRSSLRRKGWLVVAVLVLLVAVATVLLSTPSEPSYKGKSLSYWLQAYKIPFTATHGLWRNGKPIGADEDLPTRSQADTAIRAIGTNAIPTLLRLIQRRDNRHSYWQFSLARKLPFFRVAPVSPFDPNYEALMAFIELGPDAGPAVPQLVKVYYSEPDRDTKDWVIPTLTQLGPAAEPAVPMLLHALDGTNTLLRANAIFALGAIHADAPVVVPALIACLHKPEYEVRLAAVMALGDYGKVAKSAVPALLELLRDPKRNPALSPTYTTATGGSAHLPTIGQMVTFASLEIDPEAAAKMGMKASW
jgi:hypothetical protein